MKCIGIPKILYGNSVKGQRSKVKGQRSKVKGQRFRKSVANFRGLLTRLEVESWWLKVEKNKLRRIKKNL
jgi:hypothetical protein